MAYTMAVLRRDSSTRLGELEDSLPLSLDGWHDLALRIASHEYDVELILIAEAHPELFVNRAELSQLLDRTRDYLFGANVALALVTDPESALTIVDQAPSVRLWIEMASKRGVLDFFEISEEEWAGEPADVPGDLLRRNLDRCRVNRQRFLKATKGDLRPASWRTRSKSHRLNHLLMDEPPFPSPNGIRLTVIDVPNGPAQARLLAEDGISQTEVVALLRCVEKLQLRDVRLRRDMEAPLVFSTELEALYFASTLRSLGESRSPAKYSLLITHAFDPIADSTLAIASSKDIGAVLRAVGPRVVHWIVRQCTVSRLTDAFESLPAGSPVVWLHLGHGGIAATLDEPDRSAVSGETWAQIFRSSGRDLVAAVLLACQSFSLAAKLRSELTSMQCCFGFRGELGPDDGRTLAVALLPDLLSGVSNEELVRSYMRAVDSVRATGSAADPFVDPRLVR